MVTKVYRRSSLTTHEKNKEGRTVKTKGSERLHAIEVILLTLFIGKSVIRYMDSDLGTCMEEEREVPEPYK